ncbi:MAG: dinitrogenase iron-molybdenum cofactor biosynthesis protein [Proteobacteria bacterium]|nr:dinitrogenase iron-molybdenum cofactor biosynthesis protein [Pseudomonadota bacterium]
MSLPLADHKNCCCRKKLTTESVIHLPVAPQVIARTRFSPPTPLRSGCLMVPEAMDLLDGEMKKRGEAITMVAITGPGDPLATPDITIETVRMVRDRYPAVKIGMKTLGMGSDRLAGDLARSGVNSIVMQVDGINADILEKIYAWIRPGLKTLKIGTAVNLLIKEQRNGVPALRFNNIKVAILTTLYPGLNVDHVPKISAAMQVLGAGGMSLIPYCPKPGAEVNLESPTPQVVAMVAEKAGNFLPIVEPHLLPQPGKRVDKGALQVPPPPHPTRSRPNVAVVSSNGIEVDLHLGQANKLLIYGPRQDGLACLLETRSAPEPGTTERWKELATSLHDCFAVMAASAGETPRRVLAEVGIKVLITEDNIEGTVDVLYGGGKKGNKGKKQ